MVTTRTQPTKLPRPLPVLGHALQFRRQPLEFLESLRPLGDIVTIRLGRRPAYIVNSPDLIRRVLVVDAPAFEGGALLEKVRPFIGDGLITLRGAAHRQHRRLLQPAFHRSRIARYVEVMAGLAVARADSWHDGQRIAADPKRFDPDRWLAERARTISRPAFIPFGAGSRQCLGEGFAWVEATVVLATILGRWQVRPVAGQTIRKVALATLVPSRLHLVVQRRPYLDGSGTS